MKKLCLFLSACFILPFSVFAEENINNGELSSPIGTVSVYAGIESDTQLLNKGYLIANGASLLKSDYPELFAIIGTTYGSTDSNHFNLPDLRGRTVVGVKSDDSDFASLGKTGGAKSVTLTVNQIPSHTHTFTGTSSTTSSSGAHTHTFSGTTSTKTLSGTLYTWSDSNFTGTGIVSASGSMQFAAPGSGSAMGGTNYVINATHNHTYSGTTSGASANHTHTVTATGTNANTGGGQAHNNLQPYISLKYIIKVK